MTLDYILENIGWFGAGAIIILLSLIQIAPIKVNPWTAVAKAIGRAINGETIEKLDAMSKLIENNKNEDDERWASLKRSNILKFGDELRRGVGHSKEHFDQILRDITDYETYCRNHPNYMNDRAHTTIKLIEDTYKNCLKNNSFL